VSTSDPTIEPVAQLRAYFAALAADDRELAQALVGSADHLLALLKTGAPHDWEQIVDAAHRARIPADNEQVRAPRPPFELTLTKGADGITTAEVRMPAVPSAGVLATARAADAELAEGSARYHASLAVLALAAQRDLSPAIEALFSRRIVTAPAEGPNGFGKLRP
jgi:hypothetical protein